jgi:hypothetical protein
MPHAPQCEPSPWLGRSGVAGSFSTLNAPHSEQTMPSFRDDRKLYNSMKCRHSRRWLATVLIVGLVGCVFLVFRDEKPRSPDELFEKYVMPRPSGLKILAANYRSGREWLVVFHLNGSRESIDAIVRHEKLVFLEPQSEPFRIFRKDTYRVFKNFGVPEIETIPSPDIYEEWEKDTGVSIHMVSNSANSEVFLLKMRH